MTTERTLKTTINSQATSDGAGVKLRRSLGSARGLHLDPFLMLDEFFSDDPDDYIAGFPPHPHRGFETVTYMLAGRMRHEDHLGNTGDLGPGGVQWMTAGRGVIHSEMPQQAAGRMRGFQLWINLPAAEKMRPADYRDIPADHVPEVAIGDGRVRVIAGVFSHDGDDTAGPVNPAPGTLSTDPLYLDVRLAPEQGIEIPVTPGHNAFVYLYDGDGVRVGPEDQTLPRRTAGALSDGDRIRVTAGADGAGFLLVAGKPIREPVVQYGPFVMNTREEIERALADYREGTLTTAA